MFKKVLAPLNPLKALKAVVDLYIEQFRDLRPWWPLLIPFLIWRARKAYRQEVYDTLAKPGKPVVPR